MTVVEKATRLVMGRKIRPRPDASVYVVQGDGGTYTVVVWSDVSAFCSCPAGLRSGRCGALCSHALAARHMYAGTA